MEDVAALIDASGAKSVTLIGHDWGAGLAWTFAANRVRPLERLVIMNVPHPAVMAASPAPLLGAAEEELVHVLFPASGPTRGGDDRQRRAGDPQRPSTAWRWDKTNFSPDVLDRYAADSDRAPCGA